MGTNDRGACTSGAKIRRAKRAGAGIVAGSHKLSDKYRALTKTGGWTLGDPGEKREKPQNGKIQFKGIPVKKRTLGFPSIEIGARSAPGEE